MVVVVGWRGGAVWSRKERVRGNEATEGTEDEGGACWLAEVGTGGSGWLVVTGIDVPGIAGGRRAEGDEHG